MHRLDGAYERINGARENLHRLKPFIEDFTKVVANGVSLNYKEGFVNTKGKFRKVPIGTATAPINVPAPLTVSRVIGYAVQDLREALEYLVYELACFDAKRIVDKTQFVIVDSEEEFIRQNGISVGSPVNTSQRSSDCSLTTESKGLRCSEICPTPLNTSIYLPSRVQSSSALTHEIQRESLLVEQWM